MTFRILIAVFLTFAFHGISLAQQDVEKRMAEINEKFEALSEEQKKEYRAHKEKAIQGHKDDKVFTCLVAINNAQSIFKEDIDLLWLKGICYAEMHNVDAAVALYEEVMKINPRHMPTLMNLIEINYFDKRYAQALHWIRKVNVLIENFGKEEDRMPLMEFKRLISLAILSKKDEKYKEELKKQYKLHDHMDETPYYYFANALREMDAGNKEEGLIWILKANSVFRDPTLIETWNKALVDAGYVEAHEILYRSNDDEALIKE